METIRNLVGRETKTKYLIAALKGLLSDEFILMNKTSECMMRNDSPFFMNEFYPLQGIYNSLKKNSGTISKWLKDISNLNMSINDIISGSSIKNSTIDLKSRVAILENFIHDNQVIINQLSITIADFIANEEHEHVAILKGLKETHTVIDKKYKGYLKRVINCPPVNNQTQLQ